MENTADRVPGTVMVVDDELFFRQLLRNMLTEAGFTVIGEAADGVAGVAAYSQLRPEVVILDIYMPLKNGFDATRDILAMDPQAKVLICSGLGYDEDVQAALSLGAKDVILKPFIRDEVITIVSKVMGNR